MVLFWIGVFATLIIGGLLHTIIVSLLERQLSEVRQQLDDVTDSYAEHIVTCTLPVRRGLEFDDHADTALRVIS